jgi:hypothetical protein
MPCDPSAKGEKFIAEALECGVFANPREPGLTFAEINEIGARAGFREGEIGDAFVTMGLQTMGRGSKLLGPERQTTVTWKVFLPETPEYRDLEAFDFVYSEFAELARNLGQAKARMERDTLVSRAVSRGVSETGIEAAITILMLADHMVEKAGTLRRASAYTPDGCCPNTLPACPTFDRRKRGTPSRRPIWSCGACSIGSKDFHQVRDKPAPRKAD